MASANFSGRRRPYLFGLRYLYVVVFLVYVIICSQSPRQPIVQTGISDGKDAFLVSVGPEGDFRDAWLYDKGPGQWCVVEPLMVNVSESTLVVFVQSNPHNHLWRSLIRSTWGNNSFYGRATWNRTVRVIFSVGLSQNSTSPNLEMDSVLREEAQTHRDILLLNTLDNYDMLSVKGFLTMSWIARTLPYVKYIYKTDDDVILNTYAWMYIANTLDQIQADCSIVCCGWVRPPVHRQGKHRVTVAEYEFENYPSFCSGSGYLMSRAAMVAILEVASHMTFLKRDDPFFTGIIAQQTNVSVMTVDQRSYLINPRDHYLLDYRAVLLLHHPTTQDLWARSWRLFQARYGGGEVPMPVHVHPLHDPIVQVPSRWTLSKDNRLFQQCSNKDSLTFTLHI